MPNCAPFSAAHAPLFIHGLGVVGPFGQGRDALLQALRGQWPAPTPIGGAEPGPAVATAPPLGLAADLGALERYVPRRSLRRLDRLSRLTLLGALTALADAGHPLDGLPPEVGLVLGTGFGPAATTFAFLETVLEHGDALASPMLFSQTVHNAPLAHLAIHLGAQGPTSAVSSFHLSVSTALNTARAWLLEGRVHLVLVGAVDELCSVQAWCHSRLAPEGAPLPGEGGAFFLLGLAPPPDTARCPVALTELLTLPPAALGDAPLPWPLIRNAGWNAPPKAQGTDLQACYAPLWGATPAGQALDLAAAVLQLQQRRFYPGIYGRQGPDAEPGSLLEAPGLHCVLDAAEDRVRLTVSRQP